MALLIWAPNYQNKKILFRTDNSALVSIINKRTSKSKRVMQLIRPLVLATMQSNIQFKAEHVPGIENEIADSLSRFQFHRFHRLAPRASKDPEKIPSTFWSLISSLKL
jgi:hypothetical protein